MKRWTILTLILVLFLFIVIPAQSQILWRSAKTMKKGTFIGMTSGFYMGFNRSYNWGNEEWVDYPDGKSYHWFGFSSMIGFAITDRIEAMIHLPLDFKSKEISGSDISASGFGDIFLKTRVAVLPWAKDKHGLTLTGAARFGTGDEEADIALGDGTTDFALGGIFTTAWMSKFRGHLKANYWLNGKTESEYNVGDELKFVAKMDHNFSPKLMGFLTYIYYSQFEQKDPDGNTIENSNKNRHYTCIGCLIKPTKGVFIRPRVLIPLTAKGGSMFTFKPMLDFWYTFKIFK